MKKLEKKISDLKNLVDIQGSKGNWDYDEYQLGLFNGLELSLSIFEEREPKYRVLPKKKKKVKSNPLGK